ncbi:hypothetical protein JHC27_02285, partial [archaeon]|nr:hypothetical protein [archaeon]
NLRVSKATRTTLNLRVVMPIVSSPEDIFVKANNEVIENALREADKQDEAKIRRLLMNLGIQD